MGKLDGGTALVTGAGRGIGRAVALKLASEGASVVVNDLDEAPADEVVAEIVSTGGSAVVCAGSVTESGFAARFIDCAVESFGGVDIIVNNAGYTRDGVIQKMTDEQRATPPRSAKSSATVATRTDTSPSSLLDPHRCRFN